MSLFGNASSAAPSGSLFGSSPLKRSSTLPLSTDTGARPAPLLGGSLFGGGNTTTSAATPAANTTSSGLGTSFFGASNAPKPATGGLFGNSTATPQPAVGGLFGATNTAQPATGGLFGAATTSSQPAAGGLFGSAAGTGLAPTNPQNTLSSSLFSSRPAPSAGGLLGGGLAAPQPAGGSLFGASVGNQQSSLLGGSILSNTMANSGTLNFPKVQAQSVAQHTPNKSAYFDQMLERGKRKTNMENTGLSNLPSLHLGLGDIARKARNLGTGGPTAGDAKGDTRAYYLLAASGVSTAGTLRDLNNFTAQAGAVNGPAGSAALDADLDNYMANLKTQSTLEMIQEGLQQSKRDFETFLEENVQMNWDEQRKKIYSHFGLGSAVDNLEGSPMAASQSRRGAFGKPLGRSKSSMAFGASGMQKSVLGTSAQRGAFGNSIGASTPEKPSVAVAKPVEDRGFREAQEKYAAKVTELNQNRAQNNVYPILHRFAEVEQETADSDSTWISHSYYALIRIVEEGSTPIPRLNSAVKTWERRFVGDYLDENPNSAKSIRLRKRIVNGSRACLENLFYQKLEGIIARDPKVAQLGGIPQKANKIRAFIRVQIQHRALFKTTKEESGDYEKSMAKLTTIKTSGGDDYCWVLIFYLLRCGLLQDASNYVTENQKAIRDIDRNFGKYMEAYHSSPDLRLRADLRNELHTNYLSLTKIAADCQVDPYKVACYKIIGRCELSKKMLEPIIPVDQEDIVWLQFALAREVNRAEEAAGEAFGLEQLQETVKGVEQRYFGGGEDTGRGPSKGLLFFMQILAGMFENAMALLYGFNHTAAVHFSIALSYYGFLRVSNLSASDLVTYDSKQRPLLQFALMVGYYTGSFRIAKPDLAADYLILIGLNADLPGEAGKQQARLCLEGLRELVLETREFATLLGDIRSDGQRVPGAIQQRGELLKKAISVLDGPAKDIASYMKLLTVQAATTADEYGRTTDAVLLYHLAGEYDRVLTVCNRTLADALTVELGREPARLEPLKPRAPEGNDKRQGNGNGSESSQSATLSLTAVDDPVILAENMFSLYTSPSGTQGPLAGPAYGDIKPRTRETTHVLLTFATAKAALLTGQFTSCLDLLASTGVFPLGANGDVSAVRKVANKFGTLPPVLAKCIGDGLVWGVRACHGERKRLTATGWGEVDGRDQQLKLLKLALDDLGVFSGLVRYKLRQGVFEALAAAEASWDS